jgi:tetratricopeptide (TPR) repeat protein
VEFARAARALAEQIGDTRRAVFSMTFEFQAYHLWGRWGEAIRLIEEHVPRIAEVAKIELYFVEVALGEIYLELGDLDRARRHFRAGLSLEVVNPAYEWNVLINAVYLAQIDGNQKELNEALDKMLRPPTGQFMAVEVTALLPFGLALLATGRAADLRAYLDRRRPIFTRFEVAAVRATLSLFDAHLARQDGDHSRAETLLEQTIRVSRELEYAIPRIRALELKWEWSHDERARDELRALLRQIADGLPEELCRTFMQSPRVVRLGPL